MRPKRKAAVDAAARIAEQGSGPKRRRLASQEAAPEAPEVAVEAVVEAPAPPRLPRGPARPAVDMHLVAQTVTATLDHVKDQLYPNTLPLQTLVHEATNLLATLQTITAWHPKGHAPLTPEDYAGAVSLLEGELRNALNPKRRSAKKTRRAAGYMDSLTFDQKIMLTGAQQLLLYLAQAIRTAPSAGGPVNQQQPQQRQQQQQQQQPVSAPAAGSISGPGFPWNATALNSQAGPSSQPGPARQAPRSGPSSQPGRGQEGSAAPVPAAPVIGAAPAPAASAPAVAVPIPVIAAPVPAPVPVPVPVPAPAPAAAAPAPAVVPIPVIAAPALAAPIPAAPVPIPIAAAPAVPVPAAPAPAAAVPAPAPPVPAANLNNLYNALSLEQQLRRAASVRFAHYAAGQVEQFKAFDGVNNRQAIVNTHLPKPGRWPGLGNNVRRQRWRDCLGNRRLFRHEDARALMLRVRDVADAAPVASVLQDNTEATEPPQAPGYDHRFYINETTKRLRDIGLKYRRLLGVSRLGFVALFRARQRAKRKHSLFNFVAKGTLGRQQGVADFSIDKRFHDMFAGCPHIVSRKKAKIIVDDLTKRNERKYEQVTIPHGLIRDVDNRDSLLLLEYMENGNLKEFIEKTVRTKVIFPTQVLWAILECLVQQCIALRFRREDAGVILGPAQGGIRPANYLDYDPTVHFKIDPKKILLKATNETHHCFATLKLYNFAQSYEHRRGTQTTAEERDRMRLTGKLATFAPEQFSEEWDYYPDGTDGYPGPNNHDGIVQWTAGNYGSAMNVYQMGQIMINIITVERTLVPAVPVPHYVASDEVIGLPLAPEEERAIVSEAVTRYDAELVARNHNEASARRAVFHAIPALQRVDPKRLSVHSAFKLFPFDQRKRSGWIWTYAALLKMRNENGHPIYSNRGVCEPDLLDCICRMTAHRPADRITLLELKLLLNHKNSHPQATEPDPRDDNHVILDGRDRDTELYTTQYGRGLLSLLHLGIPEHNHQFDHRDRVVPYTDTEGLAANEGARVPYNTDDDSERRSDYDDSDEWVQSDSS